MERMPSDEPRRVLEKNRRDWELASEAYHRRMHTPERLARIQEDPSEAFEPAAWARITALFAGAPALRVCVPSSGDNLAVLGFARMGARVVSCDFSERQLAYAREAAEWTGLADRIDFRLADSMALPPALGQFDLVYTSRGVWVWLADLPAHFAGIAAILKPGGHLLACDVHPSQRPFDEQGRLFKRYDDVGPFEDEYHVLYHHRTQDVVNAVLGAGLTLTRLEEPMGEASLLPARLLVEAVK